MRFEKYTAQTRREWIKANLQRFEAEGASYRQIGLEVMRQFRQERPVSTATIGRDLEWARSEGVQPLSPEALELLKPENFPEFRNLCPAPGSGHSHTNRKPHALQSVIFSLTRKAELPDSLIEHFDLPEDIAQDIVERKKLLPFIPLIVPPHGKTITVI